MRKVRVASGCCKSKSKPNQIIKFRKKTWESVAHSHVFKTFRTINEHRLTVSEDKLNKWEWKGLFGRGTSQFNYSSLNSMWQPAGNQLLNVLQTSGNVRPSESLHVFQTTGRKMVGSHHIPTVSLSPIWTMGTLNNVSITCFSEKEDKNNIHPLTGDWPRTC